MSEITTTGKITEVNHVGTSKNGNPTYELTLEDGRRLRTGTDASVGYAATNYRPRTHLGEPVREVVITLTKAGRVVDIKYTDGTDA